MIVFLLLQILFVFNESSYLMIHEQVKGIERVHTIVFAIFFNIRAPIRIKNQICYHILLIQPVFVYRIITLTFYIYTSTFAARQISSKDQQLRRTNYFISFSAHYSLSVGPSTVRLTPCEHQFDFLVVQVLLLQAN